MNSDKCLKKNFKDFWTYSSRTNCDLRETQIDRRRSHMNTKECACVTVHHSQCRVHRDHVGSYTSRILSSLNLKLLKCYTLQFDSKIKPHNPVLDLASDLCYLNEYKINLRFTNLD